MRKWHLVSYDVRDDRRLRKVAQILGGCGDRLRYSVFRCRLNAIERERLLWELSSVLEPEDSLLVIPLCQQCAEAIRGRGRAEPWEAPSRYRIL